MLAKTPTRHLRKLKRKFYPYHQWEETAAGLWRRLAGDERRLYIGRCAVFMAETALFRASMWKVLDEWPISCEVNFTTRSINRQAWLGHAACCLAIGCPEEATRAAWWTLTSAQREAADEAAAGAISEWERRHEEKLCQK